MRQRLAKATVGLLSAGFFAGGALLLPGTSAESTQPSTPSTARRSSVTAELTASAKKFYRTFWGVDILGVKPVSSGTMLRFSYRVVDASKAKVLNDKTATPYLVDQKTKAKLIVPTMEKVGQLRQSSPPEVGREYWMLFSNQGNLVQPGSRVNVVIGHFHADGLIVRTN